MKKLSILLLISACCMLGSCKKFLDTKLEDSGTPENYFNSEADLNLALNGVYNRLIDNFGRMYSRGLFTFLSLSDESFYKNISISNLKVMDFDAANLEVGKLWEVLYQGVDRANLLLENVNKPVMDSTRRGYIKGEALFLRGYYYYLLVDNFGGVPLKIKSTPPYTEQYLPRSSVAEVYAQIVADMTEAENLVSDGAANTSNERVIKTTVQGILARVYLTMAGAPLNDHSKYEKALEYADKVIASGRHSLNPDFKQIFINHSQDLYDVRECIWEVGMYGNKQNNIDQAGFVGIENGVECLNDTIGYSTGSIKVTARLFNLFAANDLRRDWSIAPYKYTTSTAGVTTKTMYTAAQIYDRTAGKWRREYELLRPKNRTYNSTNFPVLRYSDILLMKAEAENEVNGNPTPAAYEAINMVRRRGYGKPVNTPDATVDLTPGLGKTAFFTQVQNERSREFCFEGMRKHDMLRWGIYVSAMNSLGAEMTATAPSTYRYGANAGKNTTARNVVFPIPNTEVTVNKLIVQNLGW